jgi:hypothetical protein
MSFTKKVNYDNWEYAYFPYLVDMYKLAFNDPILEPYCMYKFFRFIYENSSGYVSPFVRELNDNEEQQYINYKNMI